MRVFQVRGESVWNTLARFWCPHLEPAPWTTRTSGRQHLTAGRKSIKNHSERSLFYRDSRGDGNARKGEATQTRYRRGGLCASLRQGYHGTLHAPDRRERRITIGGIYNHFASKEQRIWEAVLDDKHPYHMILPLLQAAAGDSADAYVRDAARTPGDRTGQAPVAASDVHRAWWEAQRRYYLRSIWCRSHSTVGPLADVLHQKSGQVRPIPLPILARLFAGLFFSYYITELIMPPEVAALMGENALTVLLTFICTEFCAIERVNRPQSLPGRAMWQRLTSLIRKEFIQIIRDLRDAGHDLRHPRGDDVPARLCGHQ